MKASNRWLGLLAAGTLVSFAAAYTDDDSISCVPEDYADGNCDQTNNRAECGYDGGDCCSCTCVTTTWYECGGRGFACVDPNAECVNDDDVTVELLENCAFAGGFGDGRCDEENNNELCGYDGGDCCECTCVKPENSYDNDYICSADGSGFQCIDPSAPCVDDDDITVDIVENCGNIGGLGDGYCDQENNNEICDYDGGDCCECTCLGPEMSFDDHTGSIYMYNRPCSAHGSGFACIDPEAPCVNDDDVTADMVEACDDVQRVGNGWCDMGNNNELCGYDGGDCCECTCVIPENDGYFGYSDIYSTFCSVGVSGFACIDPSAPCVDDSDITVDMVENCDYAQNIGNGNCDLENNNEHCAYDGGDCCECTCVVPEPADGWGDYYNCSNGFACIDPSASCVNDDDITAQIEACDELSMGDAYCDEQNNIPECNYDGGDCCSCTCEDTSNQECGRSGGFACIDPEAACVDDDDITVDVFDKCGDVSEIGDGRCDMGNNIAECNYDGGDCCECTCVPPENGGDDESFCHANGSGFACVDPSAECVDDDSVTVDMIDICNELSVGNGFCDDYNNREECAWDGGDCCSCTCAPGNDSSLCRAFACVDPSAACVDDDDITSDMLENCGASSIGNGYCNQVNNKPECSYDGGDCCECTCQVSGFGDDYSAGCVEFACIDPEAPCVDDDSVTVRMVEIDFMEECGYGMGIGDGYCDNDWNNEDCLYDGGDCCSCTCEHDWDDDYGCSADGRGFDCKDPSAPCIGEDPTGDAANFTTDDDDAGSMSYEFTTWDDDMPVAAAEPGEENSGLRVELPAKSLFLGVALGFLFPLWAFRTC